MARRPTGVRKRGDGVWQVVVEADEDPITGKRRQVWRTVHGTRDDAVKMRARMLLEQGRGQQLGTNATVEYLLDEWLRQARLAATTRADYKLMVDKVPKRLKEMPLWKVRPGDLDKAYSDARVAGMSDHRIHRMHDVLSAAFTTAVRWEWIARNPAGGARPPAPARRDLDPPDADVLRRLVDAAEPDFAAFLRLAAVTGARRGEMCGLRWSDVSLLDGTVTIRRSIAYTPASGIVVKDTKTARPRSLSIDAGTVAALEALYAARAAACRVALTEVPDGYVWSMDLAGARPTRPDLWTHRFVRLCKALEIKGVRLHDLRHAMVTRALSAGVDVRTVAGRAGHAQASMTLNRYGHFVPASDRLAADLLALDKEPRPD
jgi:integrase